MTRPAAFLDRDGTIIADSGFLADPSGIVLLPGSAEAIVRLRSAGLTIIVVTNQSGIARQLISPDQYSAVAAALDARLAGLGAPLDATFVCPHYPPQTGPCDCRKPGLGNYRLAAERFELDLARSLFVGDRLSDVEPARATGGTGILVRTGQGAAHAEEAAALGIPVVADLSEAADRFLGRAQVP